jgi:hypothetical protein
VHGCLRWIGFAVAADSLAGVGAGIQRHRVDRTRRARSDAFQSGECPASHTQCGCGFNEWRDTGDEVQEIWGRSDEANTSIAKLVSYLREHRVESIYSCWSGDEGKHRLLARRMKPEGLAEPYFQFQERELLTLDHTP